MTHGSCSACGKRFYSMSGEARHRHNFPALCTRNARFARWADDDNKRSMREKIAKLDHGDLIIGFWGGSADGRIMRGVFELADRGVSHPRRLTCLISGHGKRNTVHLSASGTTTDVWVENKPANACRECCTQSDEFYILDELPDGTRRCPNCKAEG